MRVDSDRVVHCFLKYLDYSGLSVSRAEFEANMSTKLLDPVFIHDIEPLIASTVEWDFDDAVRYLREALLPRIPGKPWKGGGIEG